MGVNLQEHDVELVRQTCSDVVALAQLLPHRVPYRVDQVVRDAGGIRRIPCSGIPTIWHGWRRKSLSARTQGDGLYNVEYRVIGINDGVERWIATRGRTKLRVSLVISFAIGISHRSDEIGSVLSVDFAGIFRAGPDTISDDRYGSLVHGMVESKACPRQRRF